jgi:hypothetical protein
MPTRLAGQAAEPIGSARVKAGSIDALVTAYYASAKFMARPASTQRTYRGIIEPWRRKLIGNDARPIGSVRMGRKDVHGDMINVRQRKTNTALSIPLHPELARVLAATPTAITPTFLMNQRGRPFTADAFGEWFRARIDEAQLPAKCSSHGLRKAACRRLAEAGCSANQIAAISGHSSLLEIERYTRAADQQRMARQGMAVLVGAK